MWIQVKLSISQEKFTQFIFTYNVQDLFNAHNSAVTSRKTAPHPKNKQRNTSALNVRFEAKIRKRRNSGGEKIYLLKFHFRTRSQQPTNIFHQSLNSHQSFQIPKRKKLNEKGKQSQVLVHVNRQRVSSKALPFPPLRRSPRAGIVRLLE